MWKSRHTKWFYVQEKLVEVAWPHLMECLNLPGIVECVLSYTTLAFRFHHEIQDTSSSEIDIVFELWNDNLLVFRTKNEQINMTVLPLPLQMTMPLDEKSLAENKNFLLVNQPELIDFFYPVLVWGENNLHVTLRNYRHVIVYQPLFSKAIEIIDDIPEVVRFAMNDEIYVTFLHDIKDKSKRLDRHYSVEMKHHSSKSLEPLLLNLAHPISLSAYLHLSNTYLCIADTKSRWIQVYHLIERKWIFVARAIPKKKRSHTILNLIIFKDWIFIVLHRHTGVIDLIGKASSWVKDLSVLTSGKNWILTMDTNKLSRLSSSTKQFLFENV